MILVYIIVGIVIGVLLTRQIPKIKEMFNSRNRKWKVRFHTYYVVHRAGNNTNEVIMSESVEVSVRANDEDEASDLIVRMIEKEFRVEIEGVEELL